MRVMIVGANGLIGAAVTARLASLGHELIAVTRAASDLGLIEAKRVTLDVGRATRAEDWLPHLAGIDAVVNCAGLLQDAPGNSVRAVHVDGMAALFHACERAGVRRIVHVSAIGVDRAAASEFSRTKLVGDTSLMACDLDWVIVRPAVVIGRATYGGSALFRALAASPLFPRIPHTAPVQLVHLDDVVDALVFFLRPEAPSRVTVDVTAEQTRSVEEVVRLLRRWLRLPPARTIVVPAWVANLGYRLGDALGWLGWRPPIRTTLRQEIARGVAGSSAQLTELTGLRPRDVARVLLAEPASVQERWFAKLYLLKPFVFGGLSLFWIASGVIAVGPGWEAGVRVFGEAGITGPAATLALMGGAALDIVIGLAITVHRSARAGLLAALTVSAFYLVAASIALPSLWIDPLGRLLKVVPVLLLTAVALALSEDR